LKKDFLIEKNIGTIETFENKIYLISTKNRNHYFEINLPNDFDVNRVETTEILGAFQEANKYIDHCEVVDSSEVINSLQVCNYYDIFNS
jgi:hypothetical protein